MNVNADVRLTWTIPEVADLLGISRNRAYELARESAFPVIRLGRRCLVPRAQFMGWLDDQAVLNGKEDTAHGDHQPERTLHPL